MKILLLVFLFLSFLISVGCEKKPTSARLVAIDTLKPDMFFNNVFFDKATNTEFLIIENTWLNDPTKNRSLTFYSFTNGKIEKKKQINFNIPFNFMNYLILTFDSIYIIPYKSKRLFLFDGEGNEVNRWNLDLFDSDTVVYSPSDRHLIMNKGILYFYLDAIRYDNYYKQKFIGMLQIENGEIINFNKMISFPEYYQQEKRYMWYFPSFLIHKENELVISYGVSHNLLHL